MSSPVTSEPSVPAVEPLQPAACDLSTQCGHCGGPMVPEHAHYRCTICFQRDSCCDGPY